MSLCLSSPDAPFPHIIYFGRNSLPVLDDPELRCEGMMQCLGLINALKNSRDPYLSKAVDVLIDHMSGKTRKVTGQPWMIHSLRVGYILWQLGCDSSIVTAGLLHDFIEDGPTDAKRIIKEIFGYSTVFLVEECSVRNQTDPPDTRNREIVGKVPLVSLAALTILLADKLDNLLALRADLTKLGEAGFNAVFGSWKALRSYYGHLHGLFGERRGNSFQVRVLYGSFTQALKELFAGQEHVLNGKTIPFPV